MHLHGAVRGLAAESVRPVVAHGDLVGDREGAVPVSIIHAVLWISARSISHWVCSSTSGNWIAWLMASGFPKGLRTFAYATDSSMQNCAAPEARGRLADAVLVEEVLHDLASPRPSLAEDRIVADAHVGERDAAVVGGHVEGPEHLLDLDARRVHGHQKRGDPVSVSRLAARPCQDHVVGSLVDARVPGLLAVDPPARRRRARRWSPCASRPIRARTR